MPVSCQASPVEIEPSPSSSIHAQVNGQLRVACGCTAATWAHGGLNSTWAWALTATASNALMEGCSLDAHFSSYADKLQVPPHAAHESSTDVWVVETSTPWIHQYTDAHCPVGMRLIGLPSSAHLQYLSSNWWQLCVPATHSTVPPTQRRFSQSTPATWTMPVRCSSSLEGGT